ncbi:MAG: hypothetical protein IJZ80_11260 [Clostridia bacterium]|nr:hypothetical protein [Clostridia bacterium]
MGNLLLVLAVVVILAVNILFAFLRGLSKSRIRGICILVSAVIAVCVTLFFKSTLTSQEFTDAILPWLRDQGQDEIKSFLEISPTLNEIILKCLTSLIAPLVTFVLFLICMFVTWVIYLVITLIFGDSLRTHNEKAKFRLPRALVWGAVQGIVTVVILLMPVSAYLDFAPEVMDAVLETNVVDEDGEEIMQTVLDDTVRPMNDGAILKVYRTLGGKGLTCLVTDFKIGNVRTHLGEEIDSVAAFACNIARLTKTDFTEYSSDEAVVIVAISDSFEDSVLLPAIAGEIIYGATDAWLNGQAFIGIERPVPEGEVGEVTEEFLTALIRILHADARNYPALQRDIRTVADMVASLANHEIFAKIKDTDALISALSKSGIMKDLIIAVGENSSMKILIPQITNMGVRSVALTLAVPKDKEAVYHSVFEDLIDAIGNVNSIGDDKARIERLSTYLDNIFEENGLDIPSGIADVVAVAMDRDLMKASKSDTLTVDDVIVFFKAYSVRVIETPQIEEDTTSSIYTNMTQEEHAKCGAVVLGKTLEAISHLSEGDSFEREVTALLLEHFAEDDDSGVADFLREIRLSAPITENTLVDLASLSSINFFHTDYVTLEDLLIDPDEAVQKLNSETLQSEAEAIDSIFAAVEDLLAGKDGKDPELIDIAETVGAVLDSLKTGEIYGEEKTAMLFTAVLQSKTVRDTAKLSLRDATDMANKATDGDVNYKETFVSIAQSVTVLTEVGKNGNSASEEELVKLVENLNPQSAGMLEVYVTPERIEDYGVSSKYSETSADLLSDTFGYMADNDLENPEAEAQALNQVLDIAISANSHSSGKQLFSDSEREGVLPSATETVETFMASKSVTHSLRENLLDENGSVLEEKKDAFDLGRKLNEGSDEYTEFVEALDASYAENPTEETKQSLTALAALFGVDY